MKPYVSPEYYRDTYQDGAFEEDAELVWYLRQASRHIDSLTYNRIVGRGFSNLTGVSAGSDPGGNLPAGGI